MKRPLFAKRSVSLACYLLILLMTHSLYGYPIDGYEVTGIRRLEAIRLRVEKKLPGSIPPAGGLKSISDIHLHLLHPPESEIVAPAGVDEALQKRIDTLFPDRHESYSLALLDITPGQPIRFASHQADRQFSPGSVGKLAIAAGLFTELKQRYPDAPEARRKLLKERMVVADKWIVTDHHEVPIYQPETRHFVSRPIQEGDIFSLYEWADHMLSASANAAGSIVWKEVMLMRAFGADYPPSREAEETFFKKTPPIALQEMALSVVNQPLREIGIGKDQWQLGSFFTQTGQAIIPGAPSYATPMGLLLFLIRIEQGKMVDEWSSLELKRLMYMTAKRIRYASSPAITKSAVYFKSGSLYKCKPEKGFNCGQYMGNVVNYMNSVAIVETSDGRAYLVALMSNVLRKNSAVDHQTLATEIERILRE